MLQIAIIKKSFKKIEYFVHIIAAGDAHLYTIAQLGGTLVLTGELEESTGGTGLTGGLRPVLCCG